MHLDEYIEDLKPDEEARRRRLAEEKSYAVLEYLESIDRQAKVLILREVSDDYWAPVGVWQVRESVRDAFDGGYGEAETLTGAVEAIVPELPVSLEDLYRKSTTVSGLQARIQDFAV